MVNYQNGKIYKIWSPSNPDLVYIGSTTLNYLSSRMGKHKSISNTSTSKQIIDCGDARIELIEKFPCNSKEELLAREGHFIREMNCVNKLVAGRTQKEWREDNKEKEKIRHGKYYSDNKEKINEKMNEKFVCDCGSHYTHKNRQRHLKSKKHQNFMNQN